MYIHEPLDSLNRMLVSSLVQMLETKQEDVIYFTRNKINVTQVTFITDNQKPRHLDTDEEKFKFSENFDTLYKKLKTCLEWKNKYIVRYAHFFSTFSYFCYE